MGLPVVGWRPGRSRKKYFSPSLPKEVTNTSAFESGCGILAQFVDEFDGELRFVNSMIAKFKVPLRFVPLVY